MKHIDTWVDDPTLSGGPFEPPRLCIEVDKIVLPDENQTVVISDGWRTGKNGTFIMYENLQDNSLGIGSFNLAARKQHMPVHVDVSLFVQGDDTEVPNRWAIPLQRARRLVKRFDQNWLYAVNDDAAQQGFLEWELVQRNALCRFGFQSGKICGRVPSRPIKFRGHYLYLCDAHVVEHNKKRMQSRIESKQ